MAENNDWNEYVKKYAEGLLKTEGYKPYSLVYSFMSAITPLTVKIETFPVFDIQPLQTYHCTGYKGDEKILDFTIKERKQPTEECIDIPWCQDYIRTELIRMEKIDACDVRE